jgi:hypothetical protein
MKPLLRIVAGLGGVLLLAAGIGLFLPREHVATSRIALGQPPDTVWTVVRDLGGTPRVWSGLTASERLPDRGGREAWRQVMGSDAFVIEVVEDVPPRRLVTEIAAEPGAAFGGRWIYEVTPTPDGSVVTVTEDGWIANPLFRLVSRVTGHHDTLDAYLQALATWFGEPERPEHVP